MIALLLLLLLLALAAALEEAVSAARRAQGLQMACIPPRMIDRPPVGMVRRQRGD